MPTSAANAILSRRRIIGALGLTSAGALLAACGTTSQETASHPDPAPETEVPSDFAQLFAEFEPAEEPNGDLAQVVWPEFVTAAGPDVQRLYEFQVSNGDIMRYMPCFCGCGANSGHRSNRDCYVKAVHPDGSVTLDPMAPT